MFQSSDQLKRIIIGYLLILPWLIVYQKNLLPHFAQTGFDGSVIVILELILSIFVLCFIKAPAPTKNMWLIFGLWLVWQASSIISVFQSPNIYASAIKQIEVIIHSIFAYSVWIALSATQKQKSLVSFLIFTFVWLTYYILGEWLIYKEPFFVNWVHHTPFFNNIRHMGFFLIAVYPFLFLPLLKKGQWIFSLILLTVFWSISIWSASRGLFIAAIISTALIWLLKSKQHPRLFFVIVTSFLVGWIIAIQFPSISPSLNPFRLLFLNPSNPEMLFTQSYTSGRSDMWIETLKRAVDSSLLFGFGPDGFKYQAPSIHINDAVHPHSSFIQLISEYGLIGFICLVLFGLVLIKSAIKMHKTDLQFLGVIATVGFIIGSLVDGHFYYQFSIAFFAIVFAIAMTPAEKTLSNYSPAPNLIGVLLIILCIIPIQRHWSTYIEQQNILFSHDQITQVESFPSYYFPIKWLYNQYSDEELKKQAIELGKQIGPNYCNFYLVEFKNNQSVLDNEHYLESVAELCRLSDLQKFNVLELEPYLEHQ